MANLALGYLFSYKRSYLYAIQRTDIESKFSSIFLITLNSVQILFFFLVGNYYLYVALIFVFNLIENIFVSIYVSKKYEFVKTNEKLSKEEVKSIRKNVLALSANKVSGAIVSATDNILMSAFLGLLIVTTYNNYYLIVSAVLSFIRIFIHSIMGSLGNSLVLENKEKQILIFKRLTYVNFWITAFSTISLFILMGPFVTKIWLSDEYDVELLTIALISLSFFLGQTRNIMIAFRDAAGLFWNERFKPILEVTINLIFSLILVNFIGLNGIILGTIISIITVDFPFEFYIILKNYLGINIKKYLIYYLLLIIFTVSCCTGIYFVSNCIKFNDIITFMILVVLCLFIPNVLWIIITFKSKEFKFYLSLLISVLRRKKV